MVEEFFVLVNQWMTTGTAIAGLGCFLWGVVSVMLSPCHLASIPLIVAYVGGQDRAVEPKRAVVYSAVFTTGLFITIAATGIICSLLGRMLGDVGPYWQILIGLILFWVALDMFGVKIFSTSYSPFYLLKLRCTRIQIPSERHFLLGLSHRFWQLLQFKKKSRWVFFSLYFLPWGTAFR